MLGHGRPRLGLMPSGHLGGPHGILQRAHSFTPDSSQLWIATSGPTQLHRLRDETWENSTLLESLTSQEQFTMALESSHAGSQTDILRQGVPQTAPWPVLNVVLENKDKLAELICLNGI